MGEEFAPVRDEGHSQLSKIPDQAWVAEKSATQGALGLAAVGDSVQKVAEVGSQLSRKERAVGIEKRSQLSTGRARGGSLSFLDGWEERTTWDAARWQQGWQGVLQHLDQLLKSGKCGEALQYIATMIFPFAAQYHSVYKMGQQKIILNLMTELARRRNTIENAFTDCKDKADVGAAQRALDAYEGSGPLQKEGMYKGFPEKMGMKDWLKWGEKYGLLEKSFISSVTESLDEVFQGQTDAKGLSEKWHSLWQYKDSDDKKSMSIQPVTRPLQNLASQFSSQSAVVHSRLKFEETQYEQLCGEEHSFFSNIVKVENLAVSQMKGG